MSGLFKHDADERHNVQIREGLGQTLVVAHEAPEASGPGEGALSDPAAGKKQEAALYFGQTHDLQLQPVLASSLSCRRARVALINVRKV